MEGSFLVEDGVGGLFEFFDEGGWGLILELVVGFISGGEEGVGFCNFGSSPACGAFGGESVGGEEFFDGEEEVFDGLVWREFIRRERARGVEEAEDSVMVWWDDFIDDGETAGSSGAGMGVDAFEAYAREPRGVEVEGALCELLGFCF